MARFFRRAPFAEPGSARGFTEMFDWSALDRVLQPPLAEPAERAQAANVIVVKQGRLVAAEPPRSLLEARILLDRGVSVVVRRAERREPTLGALARRFAEESSGDAHIQLFITPKHERSFGWHYDAEDVFILQARGKKEYFFRENTVNPAPRPSTHYDFSAMSLERTAMLACTLFAGDWLYLPRGWWHTATAGEEDSLSISVGVLPESS